TANVSEPDSALGEHDVGDIAAAIIATFVADHLSTMPEVAVFLDAEINNPLNHIYYQGWSAGLIAGGSSQNVKFAPCVYGHHNDGETWSELGKALSAGSICGAAWIVFMDSMNFPIRPLPTAGFMGKNMPASVRVAIAQRGVDFQDTE